MIYTRAFVFLCLAAFCCFVSYDMVRRPALALFAESLGAGPSLVGLLISLSTVTGVLLKLPIGLLSDILNRRRLLLGGILAFALPPFFYPLMDNLTALGIIRLVHGLATAMYTPIALAIVGEWFAERRGEAFGWYTSAAQGGGLLGPMIGGVTVYSFGYTPTFLLAGFVGMVALIFFCRFSQENMVPVRTGPSTPQLWKEMREGLSRVWAIAPIRLTSLVEAAKMAGNGTLMAFLPLYGLVIGLNPAEIGLLFGVQALTSFLSKPMMGRVSDRSARQPLIVGGLCLCGLMLMIIPQLSWYPGLCVLSGAFGFGEAVVTSSTTALVADSSQDKRLGAGMGLRGTIMDMGHAGGPLLAGVFIEALGYGSGFLIIGLGLLLTAGYFGITMIGLKNRDLV